MWVATSIVQGVPWVRLLQSWVAEEVVVQELAASVMRVGS